MKIAAIFLILTFQATGRTIEPTVSLNLKDVPIEKVFLEIRKQTNYDFLYRDELVKGLPKVNIKVIDAKISEVLDICFANLPITYSVEGKNIIITNKQADKKIAGSLINAQIIDVKGRVLNEEGNPLANVTVTVKGSSVSTTTNSNGEFLLSSIDKNARLVFTHVSMEPFEFGVNGRTELVIKLKPRVSALEDVTVTVSTGYQDIPKERATGSFTKIDNGTLNQQVGTNILQRLDGVTSGLLFNVGKSNGNPQNNTNIAIRGVSTINGPLDPLIVLDNFVFEGDINNINPNDIESITILKDAAAASIWGARAGNGVIVITTKKGRFNEKLKIELNSNIIVREKPDLFYLPQMSPADCIDIEEFLFNKGYFDSQISSTSKPALPPSVEIFLKRKNGQISASDSAKQIDALKSIDSRDQFNKYFYNRAITQQYSLNLRGGSDVVAWLVSGTFDKSVSSLDAKDQKINLRVENSIKPIRILQLNFGAYYTNAASVNGKPGYNEIRLGSRSVPYFQFADENGTPLYIPYKYRQSYIDTAGDGKLLDWRYYPLEDYKYNKRTHNREEIIANVGVDFQILPQLRLVGKYQYQRQTLLTESHATIESFYARDIVNFYSQLDRNTGVVNRIVPLGGVYNVSNSNVGSQNFRSQLNFSEDWGKHELHAIAGGEIREIETYSNSALPVYGYKEDPLSYAYVDFITRYPTFVNGSSQTLPGSISLTHTVNRFVSVFSNFSYSYNQRYIISASFRKDGSNIFGANTNDKWRPLWSAGFAWDVSKEDFYKSRTISKLKLRATIGSSGNVDLSRSASPIANYGTNFITGFPVAVIHTLNNPELRWELSKQLNIGIDFSLKNSWLAGSIEYYHKKGIDLYGETPYDYTAWGQSDVLTKNVANIEGNGIDISFTSKMINKKFKWNSSLLLNYNVTKTTKYFDPDAEDITRLLGGGNSILPIVGKPMYAVAAYKWGGLDSAGNPLGYVNGQLSSDYDAIFNEGNEKGIQGNIVYFGSSSPVFFGAITNSFSWKGFTASINITYKFGYFLTRPALSYGGLVASGVGHGEYEKRWKKPGDEQHTSVPSFVYPVDGDRDMFYAFSEINVFRGDHIRLQYINLDYTFGKSPKQRFFERLRVYVNVSNLGILWKANDFGIDPDFVSSIPNPISFAGGLRINF